MFRHLPASRHQVTEDASQEAVIVIGLKRVTVPNWAPPLENFVAIEPESLKLAVETLELWWSFKTYYSTIRHK